MVLADSRYAEMNHQTFPSWIRSSIQTHPSSDSILPPIQRFFMERGILVERSKQMMDNDESYKIVERKRGPMSPFYDNNLENEMKRRKKEDAKEASTRQMLQMYAKDLGVDEQKFMENGIGKVHKFNMKIKLKKWLNTKNQRETDENQLPINSQQNMQILKQMNREKKRKSGPKLRLSDDYFDTAES